MGQHKLEKKDQRAKLAQIARQDSRLHNATKIVLDCILFDFMGNIGRAWPSYQTISDTCKVSLSSVGRAVREIREYHYLDVTPRWDDRPVKKNGKLIPFRKSHIYTLPSVLPVMMNGKPKPYNNKKSQAVIVKVAGTQPQVACQVGRRDITPFDSDEIHAILNKMREEARANPKISHPSRLPTRPRRVMCTFL